MLEVQDFNSKDLGLLRFTTSGQIILNYSIAHRNHADI